LFSLARLGKKEKEKGTHQKKMMGYVEVMMGVFEGTHLFGGHHVG
jgi:hypothetical protein